MIPTVTPFLVSSTALVRTIGGALVISLIVTPLIERTALTVRPNQKKCKKARERAPGTPPGESSRARHSNNVRTRERARRCPRRERHAQSRNRGFTTLLNTDPNVYDSPTAVKKYDPDCSSLNRNSRSSSVRSTP